MVTLPITQEKYITLIEGVKKTLQLKGIRELSIMQDYVTTHYDGQRVIDLIDHQIYHERTGHINIC